MSERKQVRLSDIAERLGLSKMSVSKALRNQPDISEETRMRVKSMAEEMGYVPNLVARSLSSKRSKTLGVVLPKIAHSFFAPVLDGIHERAAEEGYEIVLTVSRERAEAERRHVETLLAMQVDGLLVSVSQEQPERDVYERVRELGVPLVFFDRVIEGLGFSSVTVDDRSGARRAIEYVIEQGHEKIAHLAGYDYLNIGRERRRGYEEALRAHDLPVREDWIVEGGIDEEDGYHGFKKILETGEVPDVLFTITFPAGLGALDALREVDPERVDDLQVIAFGNRGFNRYLRRPFICVEQPTRELGRRATSVLMKEINSGRPSEAKHLVLSTGLVTLEDVQRMSYRATPHVHPVMAPQQ